MFIWIEYTDKLYFSLLHFLFKKYKLSVFVHNIITTQFKILDCFNASVFHKNLCLFSLHQTLHFLPLLTMQKLIWDTCGVSKGIFKCCNFIAYCEVNLHCMDSFLQETEVRVQAKQPDVERLLSEGQHLYKEKPSTQPVKVTKQPLAISMTP